MGLERYVIEAVVRDGRSHRDVARSAGVSKAWVTRNYQAQQPTQIGHYHLRQTGTMS